MHAFRGLAPVCGFDRKHYNCGYDEYSWIFFARCIVNEQQQIRVSCKEKPVSDFHQLEGFDSSSGFVHKALNDCSRGPRGQLISFLLI